MISKWKKPDLNICDLATLEFFKKQILTFIRPRQYSTFKLHNPQEIKLRTLLRVGLSHLKEQKFKHNCHDSIKSWCSCGNSIKSTIYFFFHSTDYTFQRQTVLNILRSTDPNIVAQKETSLNKTLLFGKLDSKDSLNKRFVNVNIGFILPIECFNCPLLSIWPISFGCASISYFSFLSSVTVYSFCSYLVFTIISYFESRCSCQSCLDSIVSL